MNGVATTAGGAVGVGGAGTDGVAVAASGVLTLVCDRDVGWGEGRGVAVNATDGCGAAVRCSLWRLSIWIAPTTIIATAPKKAMNVNSRSVRGYTRAPWPE